MKTTRTLAVLVIAASLNVFSINASAQKGPKLTDPEITSVAVVANQVDIKAGEQAKSKSKDKEVQNFANTMINDHQSVINQASALVKKLNVTPKDNDVSKKLMADAVETRRMLGEKSGKAFDKAYI